MGSRIAFILVAGALLGAQSPPARLEAIYSPALSPGVESVQSARTTLTALLRDRSRQVGIRFGAGDYSSSDLTKRANARELIDLLKGGADIKSLHYDQRDDLQYILYETIPVLADRIQLSPRIALPFTEILGNPVTVARDPANPDYPFVIRLRDHVSLHFAKKDLAVAQKAADALQVIQQATPRMEDADSARAQALAVQYRALAVKPPVTEEQRRFIVQANLLNQQKEYGRALELYRRAVAVDPLSYPAAYFNMALISAQMGRFRLAISFMKQYLLLEPEAKDARGAQDKIYEWEILLE